jgi:hypothetical protein
VPSDSTFIRWFLVWLSAVDGKWGDRWRVRRQTRGLQQRSQSEMRER